ncbi:unnamed protein product [Urochloa decumbens]|uniref:Glycosyltransferase n=1 Tax=Urochloa decumbens TaxID=240449 RepID=A0ABC9FS36_9POAL
MAIPSSTPEETPALPDIAIFPFLAKGHTIPLIHLAHYLHRHGLATVTFVTTPGNAAFVRDGLSGADAAVVELTFRADVSGIPPGVKSAEGLTSMASFAVFADATPLLRSQLEACFAEAQPPACLLITNQFLYWTNASAETLGIPKVSFFGISAFAHVMRELRVRKVLGFNFEKISVPTEMGEFRSILDSVISDRIPKPCACATLRHDDVDDDGNPATFMVPEFPHIKLTFKDFMAPFGDPASIAPMLELYGKLGKAIEESCGLIINTFHGMEAQYARPSWMEWLDKKAADGRAVLYVALGTLSAIPETQLKVVADGLERAEVDFVWFGLRGAYKGRGLVVREWVDQLEILKHESVRGFLSHCGWNSVLESVAAGVPLAVWPMHADQPFNARFLVDELKIAVRVQTSDRTIRGLVTSEEVSKVVRMLMLGEEGVEVAKNVAELSASAKEAMAEGRPSWKALKDMISELCVKKVNVNLQESQDDKVDA